MEIALVVVLEMVDDDGGGSKVEYLAGVLHASKAGVEFLYEKKIILAGALSKELVVPTTGALVAVHEIEGKVARRLALPLWMRVVKANIWRRGTN